MPTIFDWTSDLALQNRVWQRDSRDSCVIQPDSTYFNEVSDIVLCAILFGGSVRRCQQLCESVAKR